MPDMVALPGPNPFGRRIMGISASLLGRAYDARTLIGGPDQPEEFVARLDRFDCVTFVETVIALAGAADEAGYERRLRLIRYAGGRIGWRTRNHYFSDWRARNRDGGTLRPIAYPGAVLVHKELSFLRALPSRDATFEAVAVPSAAALPLAGPLLVGFVSPRPGLDFSHCGLLFRAAPDAPATLRHAAGTQGGVADEGFTHFTRRVGATLVTLDEILPAG